MPALWAAAHTPPVQDKWAQLAAAFFSLFRNKASRAEGQRRRNGAQASGIDESLNGKEGDIRKHAAGKRSSQSARAVLSGTTTGLSMGGIGINGVMQRLTKKIRVCDYMSRDYVQQLAAKATLIEYDNTRINVQFLREKRVSVPFPETGAVVHVPIDVGDYVIFNRQPTLGPLSFQGCRIEHVANPINGPSKKTNKSDGFTIRIHLCITPPLNADFDGM